MLGGVKGGLAELGEKGILILFQSLRDLSPYSRKREAGRILKDKNRVWGTSMACWGFVTELSCDPSKAQGWWLRAGWEGVAGAAAQILPCRGLPGQEWKPSLLHGKHRHLLRNRLSISSLLGKERAGGGQHEKGRGELEGFGDSQE